MSESVIQSFEPERARQRRNQVLDAAAACFRRYGFHGCSMALLAKESGMSVGHIYHYFQNKEAIIEAIVKRDLYECLEEIDQLCNSPQLQQDLHDGLADAMERNLEPDNAALQFEILSEAARNPKVAQTVHAAHQHARVRLSEMLQLASALPMSPEVLASKVEILCVLFDGLMVNTIRHPDMDKTALLRIFRSTVQHILDF